MLLSKIIGIVAVTHETGAAGCPWASVCIAGVEWRDGGGRGFFYLLMMPYSCRCGNMGL